MDVAVNGAEAVRRFKEMPERTYDAVFMDIEKALAAGMNTHVCKPVDMDLLGVALSQLITLSC